MSLLPNAKALVEMTRAFRFCQPSSHIARHATTRGRPSTDEPTGPRCKVSHHLMTGDDPTGDDMATSRTGEGAWKRRRAQRVELARSQGQTTCSKCGRWLDYNTHGQPNSPEVNHDEAFAMTGEIAPPLEKLSVWCRACNGSDGGRLGNARRGRGDSIKTSQAW